MNKHDKKHLKRLEAIARMVERIYDAAADDAAAIGAMAMRLGADGEVPFSFDDYPQAKARMDELLSWLRSQLEVVVAEGVAGEWQLSEDKNDELVRRVLGLPDDADPGDMPEPLRRRWLDRNEKGREAFLKRKERGLGLSERVWRGTQSFPSEIAMGIDMGILDGKPAASMARDLKQYLKHPDKLFRRVRDERGILHLSKNAAAFHPGQGVYRSSYQNARRLAVTEDFKFTGWHPHCRCYATSILKTEEELESDTQRMMAGEPVDGESVNKVEDVPENFKGWMKENEKRIAEARKSGTLPGFVRENEGKIKVVSNTPKHGTAPKRGRNSTSEGYKYFELHKNETIPTLHKKQEENMELAAKEFDIPLSRPMSHSEANNGKPNIIMDKENCQSCVVVYEARLRGLDITALQLLDNKTAANLSGKSNLAWWKLDRDEHPQIQMIYSEKGDLQVQLNKQTVGVGRYHIGVNYTEKVYNATKRVWEEIEKGHIFVAQRFKDGRIFYYDPQKNEFINMGDYIDSANSLELIKVDKLRLNLDVLKEIATPVKPSSY